MTPSLRFPTRRPLVARLALSLALTLGFLAAGPASAQPLPTPYAFDRVNIGGGGNITGLVVHPAVPDLVYAKSDTAGLFRWDAPNSRWLNLTDWAGIEERNLKVCDSFAIDPSAGTDPVRRGTVYAALGMYYSNTQGNIAATGIYRSTDYGATWTRIWNPPVFQIGGSVHYTAVFAGNVASKHTFARLAVDPANPDILYAGTATDGLYRSVNARAATPVFTKLATAPAGYINNSSAPRGINSILIDSTGGTVPADAAGPVRSARVYLALERNKSSQTPAFAGGIWQSADGGASWSRLGSETGAGTAISAGPVNPTRMAIGPGGSLLVSSRRIATEDVNFGVSLGGVFKWTSATATWSVLPGTETSGFLNVDTLPTDRNRIIMGTYSTGIWRATDGGATATSWVKKKWNNATGATNSEITYSTSPGWMQPGFQYPGANDLRFDPHYPNRVWGCDSFGIGRSTDIWASPIPFSLVVRGLETTVVWSLAAPPVGPRPLYATAADVNAWAFSDTTTIPPQQLVDLVESNTARRNGDAVFPDLAWTVASSAPDVARLAVVRATGGGYGDGGYYDTALTDPKFGLYLSADSGSTWVRRRLPGTTHPGPAKIAFSATDPDHLVFVGAKRPPYFTTNAYTANPVTWTAGTGVTKRSGATLQNNDENPYNTHLVELAADAVAGQRFFYRIADPDDQKLALFMTNDGGATWLRAFEITDDADAQKRGRAFLASVKNPATAKGELWIGLRTRGLHRCTDTGASPTTLAFATVNPTRIVDAVALTFGAPAPGQTTPTLYVVGKIKVDGVNVKEGLFLSGDYGATWTQMTADGFPLAGGHKNFGDITADQVEFGKLYVAVGGQGIIETSAQSTFPITGVTTTATGYNSGLTAETHDGIIQNSGSFGAFMLSTGNTVTFTFDVPLFLTNVRLAMPFTVTKRLDLEALVGATWTPLLTNQPYAFTQAAYKEIPVAPPTATRVTAIRVRARDNDFHISEIQFQGY